MSVFSPIILFLIITVFPIKMFYNNIIVLFSPQRIVQSDRFGGYVLGNYIFETEYGRIKIERLSFVIIFYDSLVINSEIFKDGKASHNLVFLGSKMPEHLSVWFNRSQITYFDPKYQDMSIYGVPVRTGRIHINSPRNNADILFYDGISFLQEQIKLADSAEINVTSAMLSIYKDEQRWVLEAPSNWRSSSLFVKQVGETEFTRYSSITFRPDWGEFIEGELFE